MSQAFLDPIPYTCRQDLRIAARLDRLEHVKLDHYERTALVRIRLFRAHEIYR